MEDKYTLKISGLTEQQAKDMVESEYGAVMWTWIEGNLVSYPTTNEHPAIITED